MSAGCSNIANPRNWSCLVKSTLKIHKQTPLAIYLNLRCYRCFPCKKEPLICHETRRFAAPAAPHPSCSAASHVYPELQSSARPLEQQIHCRQNLIPWFSGKKKNVNCSKPGKQMFNGWSSQEWNVWKYGSIPPFLLSNQFRNSCFHVLSRS